MSMKVTLIDDLMGIHQKITSIRVLLISVTCTPAD